MAGSKRKKSSDEGGGANWMDTYGDLVTLLMTFFVLLYSFSVIDAQKLKEFSASFSKNIVVAIPAQYDPFDMADVIESPIGSFMPAYSEDPAAQPTDSSLTYQAFIDLLTRVGEHIDNHGIEAEFIPSYSQFTVTLRFRDRVFFTPGSAVIQPEASYTLEAMKLMIEELQPFYEMLRIEGHTDNTPINTPQYPNNWILSQARSSSVLEHLLASSELIDITKLTISGYSEYHPIDTNDTAEGRSKNRRVDFVIEGYRD